MRPTPNPALPWCAAMLAGLVTAAIAACGQAVPSTAAGGASGAAPAGVVIQSPPSNVQVGVGQALEIVTTAVAAGGVGWIELQVGGAVVSRAVAPSPMPSFSAVHVWTPTATGSVAVSAMAYGADGTPGEPFGITVFVLPAGASIPPIPTYDGPRPTVVVTALATGALPPATFRATYAPPTEVDATAPGYSAASTSAAATYAAATPTYAPTATTSATATYAAATPTSAAPTPTHTTSPTASVAPPDTTYAWLIPYKGSSEITDVVSYPGDTEDRVNYDVSGMSASPPGNTGHLNVFVTCEGTGIANIQVKVGQATFPCNTQVIVSQFITDESRTGSIRIIAAGPAYVRWTLSGNVAP